MPDASIGLVLTRDIAEFEAGIAQHELIEPGHLFIGLCSLEKVLLPEVQRQLRLPDEAAQALRAECETLLALFARFGIDPTIRRELRQRVGLGNCAVENRRTISRAPASRALFKRAEALAANAAIVATLHLLVALLEETSGRVVALLTEKGVDVAALHAAVTLAARYLPERHLPDKAIDLLDEACARIAVPALSVMPGEAPHGGGIVTADAVASVLADWTGIPVAHLTTDERSRLLGREGAPGCPQPLPTSLRCWPSH